MNESLTWFEQFSQLHTLLAACFLVLAALATHWVSKAVLSRWCHKWIFGTLLSNRPDASPMRFITRLSNVIPALIIYVGIRFIKGFPADLITVVQNVCSAFIVLTLALALGSLLDFINKLYQYRPNANRRPIKGYIQVVKILIFAVATILIIASLIDRSPLILFSGLGALAAVLMLIFQDTLLSLVASVQISSSDMIRVGDWVEMPQLNADGDVIDIALHTVKVQNWDKTITTIPTKRLITESFKNWRGMQESGGRRIKRCLYIDQQSIRFLEEKDFQRLERFVLIDDYLSAKLNEIQNWNTNLGTKEEVNYRRLTNIGTFRAYVARYLKNHAGIHQQMTLLVRQLSPTGNGLPLEIYCFANTTAWANYEDIQSDIFDHLLSVIPEFGLRVFQNPSGADFRELR
ncbi:MAG: mechanosensitive ion channel family protein [Azoarcus sp.]|jgi:miniconductance mechanosensitive channel|nr:mechanosensitive ion channel family protein [Azoarcus sp.]